MAARKAQVATQQRTTLVVAPADELKAADSVVQGQYERVALDNLYLDDQNPRLAELGLRKGSSQADLIKALWEHMAVEEIALSIAHSGYFDHEPLFVESAGSRFTVIEGNRRLAAVKILCSSSVRTRLKATKLPVLDARRTAELKTLPVIFTTRKEAWRYLGFKHVNGPATWGSYAKAQYIALIHNEYGVPLRDIAEQIGDYNSTVLRMYRGLMIVEQAERVKVFSRDDVYKDRFYFNYIYTGMDYPGITAFLGLDPASTNEANPVPKAKYKNLGDLMHWLYGSKSSDTPSLIRSQNPDLKTLDTVLLTDSGVKALRDGLSLSIASEIGQGDDRIFRQSLQQAKQNLQKAHGTRATGYWGDLDPLNLAQDILTMADALVETMIIHRKLERREARKSK